MESGFVDGVGGSVAVRSFAPASAKKCAVSDSFAIRGKV
jgi:hypothetical protein